MSDDDDLNALLEAQLSLAAAAEPLPDDDRLNGLPLELQCTLPTP